MHTFPAWKIKLVFLFIYTFSNLLICLYSPGTIYIVEPSSQKMIVSGGTTEMILTNSIGIPQPLPQLSIEAGATVKIESSLNIQEILWSETTPTEVCKLIIADSSTLTVTTLGDEHKGFPCNIEIEDGSTLNGDILLVAGASPSLALSGSLSVNNLTIYNNGLFNVSSTASLSVSSLTLNAWSVTDMEIDTKLSFDRFILGYEAEIKFHHDLVEFEMTETFKMESGSLLTLLGTNKNVDIVANRVIIEDSASIDVTKGGEAAGTGAGSTSRGASHGGEGGDNVGTTYGSTEHPVASGSGSIVQGGGTVTIDTVTVVIDGSIISDGKNGSSGGSIYIKATSAIEGHGQISASGGNGDTNGGGGGRIAVMTEIYSSFYGSLVSYGGSGSNQPGAAGTIYEEYSQSGNTIKNIIVNNNAQVTDAITWISDVNDLTELKISGNSKIKFAANLTNPIAIRKITGDYSGVLTIEPAQSMEIATVYGTVSPYALQCKLVVPETAYAELPPKLLLKDDDLGSDWNNLEIGGSISGLQELTVATGGRAIINSTGKSGSEPAGTFSVSKLDVTTNGELFLGTDTMDQYTIKVVSGFNVKYGGTLTGRNLSITATPILQVAYNGLLNVDGGSEVGGSGNGIDGAGGSHGGSGGSSEAGVEPPVNYTGEIHAATEAGSVGGDFSGNTGGFGGGVIVITDVTTLTLNGKISASGNSGGNGTGGGSGGAISLTNIQDVTGSGSIAVSGGSSDSGGGGGGGRIRFVVSGEMNYEGTYILQGGSSTTGGAGGSGTASVNYKETGVFGTVLDVHVDNSDIDGGESAVDGITYIDIPGTDVSEVSNLIIGDNTTVHLQTAGLHFKAKALTCGSGSTVVVGDNVTFSADTEVDYSVMFCSFNLYTSGELRFPASIELKGEDNQLKGNNP